MKNYKEIWEAGLNSFLIITALLSVFEVIHFNFLARDTFMFGLVLFWYLTQSPPPVKNVGIFSFCSFNTQVYKQDFGTTQTSLEPIAVCYATYTSVMWKLEASSAHTLIKDFSVK